jgi:hypothetical protein
MLAATADAGDGNSAAAAERGTDWGRHGMLAIKQVMRSVPTEWGGELHAHTLPSSSDWMVGAQRMAVWLQMLTWPSHRTAHSRLRQQGRS